jgi:heparan-alpha-glucosaminide N-acetyltransferase
VAAFALLYWLCDIKKKIGWAFAFRPRRLQHISDFSPPQLLGHGPQPIRHSFFHEHFQYGWRRVVKSTLFTCLMLGISAILTKRKIRLAL